MLEYRNNNTAHRPLSHAFMGQTTVVISATGYYIKHIPSDGERPHKEMGLFFFWGEKSFGIHG